jgi:serine protease Do
MGIGFAIPSDLAAGIAAQLVNEGAVTRGFLGIIIQDLTQDLADSFDLDSTRGILVSQVSPGSPAENGGIQEGDVIVAYQGNDVRNVGAFRNQVSLTAPGTDSRMTVIRDGAEMTLNVTIGTLENEVVAAEGSVERSEQIGLGVQTLTPQLAQQFGVEPGQGVVVTQVLPGSAAEAAGLSAGLVILEVNRNAVVDAEAFNRAIRESDDERALLLVRTPGGQRFVVLEW